jgi:tetratricopeptide (TPR) repeat protein
MTSAPRRGAAGEAVLRAALRGEDSGVHRLGGADAALFVRGAETWVAAGDPLAERIAAWAGTAGATRLLELRALAGLLAERLAVMAEGEAIDQLPADAVGPLPTAAVMMEAAALGDADELLASLGGPDARYRGSRDRRLPQQLSALDSPAMFLLSRFEAPTRVGEALVQAGMERRAALETLCRLRAIGLLEPAEAPPPAAAPDGGDEAVVGRFAERIGRELRAAPLRLAVMSHRAKVGDLLATHGGKDHYELLGVDPSASTDEIHRAYEELARLIHPSHAELLGLSSRTPLDLLFERATHAYRTLTDPGRRGAYNLALGIETSEQRGAAVRRDEQRKLARQLHEQAGRYAEGEQYHFAVELLHQAIRMDPRAEYHARLGACLAKNPRWIAQAIQAYEKAVQLDPRDVGSSVMLGELHAKQGDAAAAKRHYERALELMPGHPDAEVGLERLDPNRAKRSKRGKRR